VVLELVLFLPLPLTSCQDNRASLSSLLVLYAVPEKSAVGVSVVFVVATWYMWIV
jgi:hypothetical protein